jgi:hypothetical protein
LVLRRLLQPGSATKEKESTSTGSTQGSPAPGVVLTIELFGDKRFEFLREEDSNKVKAPVDVIIAIAIQDEDQVQSALNLANQGTAPFTKGFSDENYPSTSSAPATTPRTRASTASTSCTWFTG